MGSTPLFSMSNSAEESCFNVLMWWSSGWNGLPKIHLHSSSHLLWITTMKMKMVIIMMMVFMKAMMKPSRSNFSEQKHFDCQGCSHKIGLNLAQRNMLLRKVFHFFHCLLCNCPQCAVLWLGQEQLSKTGWTNPKRFPCQCISLTREKSHASPAFDIHYLGHWWR